MQKLGSAIILMILGLIVLAFPLLGLIPFSLISGFIVLILGIGLLLGGITEMDESVGTGIVGIILGLLALILGIGFIYNLALFSFVTGLIVYIVGIFLIITGIIGIISDCCGNRLNGVLALVIGISYLIVGVFIAEPRYLGILIGFWLLFTGILMIVKK
ncbi:MAG: DUF308 domain-containing protein [Methanobacterium sp.]|nr:DUF308 domain-containing protein [Methanobacterium sp.]